MSNHGMRTRTAALLSLGSLLVLRIAVASAGAGNVTDERVATDTSGDSWLVKGGSFAQMQYSPLREITGTTDFNEVFLDSSSPRWGSPPSPS